MLICFGHAYYYNVYTPQLGLWMINVHWHDIFAICIRQQSSCTERIECCLLSIFCVQTLNISERSVVLGDNNDYTF